MKKQYMKRNYTRAIDLLFLFVYLIISFLSISISFRFGMLPKKWILLGFLVICILFFILFILSLRKLPTWALITKRTLIVFLSILIGTVGFLQYKSQTTLQKMATPSDTKRTIEIYTLAATNSTIAKVSDLEGKTIGFQTGVDKENATYAKQQLAEDIRSYKAIDQLDYTSLLSSLQLEKLNAVVMSSSYYNMSKANIKDFDKQVKIVHTFQREIIDTKPTVDMAKNTFTVYLSGLDNMGSPDQKTRSDTNLLLIVNPIANHINMVSLPRDGYVPNASYNFLNDKLAHTGNDGIENSVKTLENFLGIPIDYYARVSFNSLIEIVDTLGDIHVDVELNFCEQDEYRSFAKEDLICLNKGKQKLNGKQALAYSRHRKTLDYGNPGRERAQQRIIKAIINKLLSPTGITSINSLFTIAPNYIITNMPVTQISNFVSNELEDLKPWTISTITSSDGVTERRYVASIDKSIGPSDVYLFNRNEIHAIVNAYDGAKNQLKMNTYSFDLNNLYKHTPPINTSENVIYADMAVNPT